MPTNARRKLACTNDNLDSGSGYFTKDCFNFSKKEKIYIFFPSVFHEMALKNSSYLWSQKNENYAHEARL